MATSYTIATPLILMSFMIASSTISLFDLAFASSDDQGCAPGYACSYYPYKPTVDNMHHNRKILMGSSNEFTTGAVLDRHQEKEAAIYGEEMRNVPSGPDPLHHKGGPQKRPRISP